MGIRKPAVDRFECTDCESCLELCPEVFQRNADTGHIEVADLSDYPEDTIQEVISMCPADCIQWEGSKYAPEERITKKG